MSHPRCASRLLSTPEAAALVCRAFDRLVSLLTNRSLRESLRIPLPALRALYDESTASTDRRFISSLISRLHKRAPSRQLQRLTSIDPQLSLFGDADEPPLSIVNAPYPFPNESAASWIQRVCQLHGLTYKALSGFLGIKACRDPDVAVPRHFVCFIGLGTGISGKRLRELADVFHAVRLHPPSKALLNFHDGTPSYRFCPQCIATDLVPYLRIEWRFKDWTVCPKHQVKMLERCPHCGAPILGTMPCLGMSEDDEALGVGHCTFCERPLATTTESYPQTWVSPTKLKVQNAIVSAVRRGGLRLEGYYWPVSLDFILWLRDNPELVKSCFERRYAARVLRRANTVWHTSSTSTVSNDGTRRRQRKYLICGRLATGRGGPPGQTSATRPPSSVKGHIRAPHHDRLDSSNLGLLKSQSQPIASEHDT